MVALQKKVETVNNSKRTSYQFHTGLIVNDVEIVMDVTDRLREANQRDKKLDYGIEDGPHFGIEVARAGEYLEYFQSHATQENYYRFNTRPFSKGKQHSAGGYSFFPLSDGKSQ